jgi:uncharacterized protein YbjQ (UPF0145 family)/ribosomal protein L40E
VAVEPILCPKCRANNHPGLTNCHECKGDLRPGLSEELKAIIVTTTPHIEGKKITEYLGPVFAEHACGINMLKDFLTSVTDSLGGRSGTLQKTLKVMQENVIREMKERAGALGAQAIVGVDFDYLEYREGMLILVANGTAVKI